MIYSNALDLSIFDKIKRQISSRRRNSPEEKRLVVWRNDLLLLLPLDHWTLSVCLPDFASTVQRSIFLDKWENKNILCILIFILTFHFHEEIGRAHV